MKSPSPVPGFEAATSARPNFSKITRCWSYGIPGPWSLTSISTRPSVRRARTATSSPAGEYLTALFGLVMDRETLFARIDQRVEEILAAGAAAEVERAEA